MENICGIRKTGHINSLINSVLTKNTLVVIRVTRGGMKLSLFLPKE
jgi:hypothetical protein